MRAWAEVGQLKGHFALESVSMTVEASIELRREKGRARSPRFYDNSPVVIVAVPVADRMCTSFYVMISKLNVYRKVLCDCPSIDLEIVEVIRLCNK
jgi:hypothetical protein